VLFSIKVEAKPKTLAIRWCERNQFQFRYF
jgi:hypothetical protein